jgi:MoaA/NifB/PqqE/SkfB family radical SAM enzyme
MKLSHIFTYDFQRNNLFIIPDQPVNVMLDVTNVCNNRCLFCYNPDSNEYRNLKPDFQQLQHIVLMIANSGTKEILYVGGEPFAFPKLKSLLSIGKRLGMFQRAISNGSFFADTEKCREFKDSGLDEVGISFHSSIENLHDRISGRKGAFRDAIKGVENCLIAGVQTFVQYSPNTLNAPDDLLNLSNFLHMRFAGKISLIDINRLLPLGKGFHAKSIFLSEDSWFDLLVSAAVLPDLGYEVRVELTPHCWIMHKATQYHIDYHTIKKIFHMNRGCYMWISQLALDFRGRIKFCPAGPPVGPSILDVKWPDFWKQWEPFITYRQFGWNNTCVNFKTKSGCRHFYSCLGGCKYSKGTHYELDSYCREVDRPSSFTAEL